MAGPRDYHTKWSKSERERQIPYHFYVESKIRHKWIYETETAMEKRLVAAKGEGVKVGWTGSLGLADANYYK